MLFLAVLLLAVAVILFLIAPSGKSERGKMLKGISFAHCGLHGNGICENTLAAFELACRKGFGIELDIQLTKNGEVVVFHDNNLMRMLGDSRRLDNVDSEELISIELPDGQHIPVFSEVLQCINGRVPILVELKNGNRNDELCKKAMALIQNYEGTCFIQSFNPMILRWFRRNAPQIVRGQLVGNVDSYIPEIALVPAFMLSRLVLNFLARPDFIAYDVSAQRFHSPKVQRVLFRTAMAAWTVRDSQTYEMVKDRGEVPIFEGFLPEN